jgi:hypothetical protein
MLTHRFYTKPDKSQLLIIWATGLLAVGLCGALAAVAYLYEVPFIYLLAPLPLIMAAPFVDAPLGKRQGKLVYYSPLLITEKEHKDEILIHGGTLFDYVYTLDRRMSGRERTEVILHSYIEGLLKLVEAQEELSATEMVVRGTSYIINERTAQRIGLHVVKTDLNQVLILLINYLPLTIAYSYARAKLSLPSLSKVKTYEASINDLISHKPVLIALEKKMRPGNSEIVQQPY